MTKFKGPWYLEITPHRHGKNVFIPSQPKIDLAKLRSQISCRADDSFPVFARPFWHAEHADRDRSIASECLSVDSIKRLVKIKLTRSFKSIREYASFNNI